MAESDDVPGLATGADSLDALIEKLKIVIPDLLREVAPAGPPWRHPFAIIAERHERAPVAA